MVDRSATVPAEPLRLLDASASLGRHPAHDVGTGTPGATVSGLDRYGISEAVVAHTLATHHDPVTGNARLLADVADQPRLRPCWTALPPTCGEFPAGPELVAQARASGVGLLTTRPGSHGFELAGPDMAPLLEAAAGHGLPLLIDAAETDWRSVEQVATAHPELWLILTEVGYRELRRLCGLLERRPRVLLCTANLSGHLALEFLVDRFGAHRLVFGTGQPVRDPGEAVLRLLWSELDDDAVRAIGGDTMRQLLAASRPVLEVG
ncbi:amidohydrolase family protein [Phytoactinopolyspora alkaliphila]|uniref:Amidohydrolase family protein n=1 Tax=Phytoactinopolyspora alkaliphila TaxID=1783498 RepID=A0A6N9YP18_9ACTN|nr:amidohydrolase family protein [Phytoactinopolyspora alkaliphila]NED96786.1 amidohydrolase family protein [Phytoactinopolyspora alkaliphila]